MKLSILLIAGALLFSAECLPVTEDKELRELENALEDYLERKLESKIDRHDEREREPILNSSLDQEEPVVPHNDPELSDLDKKIFTFKIKTKRPGRRPKNKKKPKG